MICPRSRWFCARCVHYLVIRITGVKNTPQHRYIVIGNYINYYYFLLLLLINRSTKHWSSWPVIKYYGPRELRVRAALMEGWCSDMTVGRVRRVVEEWRVPQSGCDMFFFHFSSTIINYFGGMSECSFYSY